MEEKIYMNLPPDAGDASQSGMVKVWDLFVRVFHWSVAAGFFIAYFTEDDFMLLHVWTGYVVGALVVMRVVWGFIGPKHARFSDFIYSPFTVWRYLAALAAFRAKRHLGHSPAGGAMTAALLLMLAVVVWTGLNLYVIEYGSGPLLRLSISSPAVPRAILARQDGSDDDDYWEELHEVLSHLLLFLVILHIGGVALASRAYRENLTRGMISGLKRVGEKDDNPLK